MRNMGMSKTPNRKVALLASIDKDSIPWNRGARRIFKVAGPALERISSLAPARHPVCLVAVEHKLPPKRFARAFTNLLKGGVTCLCISAPNATKLHLLVDGIIVSAWIHKRKEIATRRRNALTIGDDRTSLQGAVEFFKYSAFPGWKVNSYDLLIAVWGNRRFAERVKRTVLEAGHQPTA